MACSIPRAAYYQRRATLLCSEWAQFWAHLLPDQPDLCDRSRYLADHSGPNQCRARKVLLRTCGHDLVVDDVGIDDETVTVLELYGPLKRLRRVGIICQSQLPSESRPRGIAFGNPRIDGHDAP